MTDLRYISIMLTVLIEKIIPVLIGLGLLLFIFGLIKYMVSRDDKTREDARQVIVYGVITLFVMVSVWGLVNLLASTFGIDILKATNINYIYQSVD